MKVFIDRDDYCNFFVRDPNSDGPVFGIEVEMDESLYRLFRAIEDMSELASRILERLEHESCSSSSSKS